MNYAKTKWGMAVEIQEPAAGYRVPAMSTKTQRAEFEKWVHEDYFDGLDDAGKFDEDRNIYVDFPVHMAWLGWNGAKSSQAAEIAALKAENEALRKDAERYRWLRDPCSGAERVIFYRRGDYGKGLMSGSMLDAEIDAAMPTKDAS